MESPRPPASNSYDLFVVDTFLNESRMTHAVYVGIITPNSALAAQMEARTAAEQSSSKLMDAAMVAAGIEGLPKLPTRRKAKVSKDEAFQKVFGENETGFHAAKKPGFIGMNDYDNNFRNPYTLQQVVQKAMVYGASKVKKAEVISMPDSMYTARTMKGNRRIFVSGDIVSVTVDLRSGQRADGQGTITCHVNGESFS